MNEKPTKGQQFDTVILDDMCEGEVSDEQMEATIEWHEKTQALLKEEEEKVVDEKHRVKRHEPGKGGSKVSFWVKCPDKEYGVVLMKEPSHCPMCSKELLADEREEKTMKDYMKIIKAEPMDEHVFMNRYKGKTAEDKDIVRLGYHVRYPDGYDSWFPKDVFEVSYRLVTEAEYDLMHRDDSAEKKKDYFRAESVPNEDPD